MHGEVLVSETTAKTTPPTTLTPVRLWCDARNAETGDELTQLFQCKVPKRVTAARFLWTTRNKPETAEQTRRLTTPAGWCAFRLTGEWNLGIGEASGMFPIDGSTRDYDQSKLQIFDHLVNNSNVRPLRELLPTVKVAGEHAGFLTPNGAVLLGLPEHYVGIPVAPAEGDQIAAVAGSLIGSPGMLACSFGTSVCVNAVGDRPFKGVHPAVDQYCAADGAPLNMVWLRNGTTFLNTIIQSFGGSGSREEAFRSVMPDLLAAPSDCGGLLALPFMDDEPGLQVEQGGTALIVGWNTGNATPGNAAKAALLSTMFNLKLGVQVLDQQGYPRNELVLTGGLAKTPECGQILADVFNTPVTLRDASDEGCSWGAAALAKYRKQVADQGDTVPPWASFVEALKSESPVIQYQPDIESARVYERLFARYQKLLRVQSQLSEVQNMTA